MKRAWQWPFDLILTGTILILLATGIATIFTITFSNGSSLTINQTIAAFIGLVGMVVFAALNYRILDGYRWIIYIMSVIMLIPLLPQIAPHIPFAQKTFGAYRWYDLKITQIQPSEILKLGLSVVAAGYLSRIKGGLKLTSAIIYLLICAIPVGLVIIQPDLGTGLILLAIVLALFIAAKPTKIVLIIAVILMSISLPLGWANLADYQRNRLETFINPSADPLKKGYNVRQALIAIGSGQLTGRGFGEGSQTTMRFLPVAHADFIFAGYAEATGFVGCVVILLLYGLMLYRVSEIALRTEDKFAGYFALAVGVKLLAQIVINVGMNIALMPVAGVPLPLMSYGGTALIMDLVAFGVLQSIYIRSNRQLFG